MAAGFGRVAVRDFRDLLVAAPGAGALGLLIVIAAYAFVAGFVLTLLGFKLRALANRGLRHATA